MTIAIFTECYRPIVNGVVVSVTTFARELIRLGFDITIYAPAYPGYRDEEPNVFRVWSLALPTNPRYPLALPFPPRLRRQLNARPPALVHTQSPLMMGRLGARVARRRGTPLVFTYHTLIEAYAHYVPLPRGLVRREAVRLSRRYANQADCVVVPTSGIREVLRGYGVERRIEVIPTGVDLELARQSRAPIRSRWAIPAEAPLLLYAGRIAREKSTEVLLEAFARLSAAHPQAHLLLAGGGPWLEHCRQLAAGLGVGSRVHFAGFLSREEVFRCCADADVLVFTSMTDTQGLVLLEAMAVGTPCVAARSAAAGDVVVDGRTGLLAAPDAASLAEAVSRLLRDDGLRRSMGEQARIQAERFSAPACAARLAALYRELAPASAD